MVSKFFKEIKRIFFGICIILVCIIADILCYLWMIPSMIMNGDKWWKIAIAKDQAINAALGGSEDETLSSRAARSRNAGEKWGCVLCKFLDILDPNHCTKSLLKEINKRIKNKETFK